MPTDQHLPHNQRVAVGEYNPVADANGVLPGDDRVKGRVCGYQDTGLSPLSYLVMKESDGTCEWFLGEQLETIEEPAADPVEGAPA